MSDINFNMLVPVTEHEGKCWVDARKLHEVLGVGRFFANWIRERIEKYGFVEGVDYVKNSMITVSPILGSQEKGFFSNYGGFLPDLAKTSSENPEEKSSMISGLPNPASLKSLTFSKAVESGAQGRIEYSLTTDMAKQLCMVENNDMGLLARKYFIACEKKLQEVLHPRPMHVPMESPVEAAEKILRVAGLEPNQIAIGMSNVYRKFANVDILVATEIPLPSPVQKQTLTPTQLGEELNGISARKINKLLVERGYQERRVNGGYDPTALGIPHALLLDTAKRHSDGTPVKQLKWYTSILPILSSWLDEEDADV